MQLSGSFLQSVLHLNLSQVIHPIGGVLANPLSNEVDPWIRKARDSICHMLIPQVSDWIALIIIQCMSHDLIHKRWCLMCLMQT